MSRPGRKQARPLTDKEIIHLENFPQDTNTNLFNKFAVGTPFMQDTDGQTEGV